MAEREQMGSGSRRRRRRWAAGLALFAVLLLVGWSVAYLPPPLNTWGMREEFSASRKFTPEQLQGARDAIVKQVDHYTGCRITRIVYDEQMSNTMIASELEMGPNNNIFYDYPQAKPSQLLVATVYTYCNDFSDGSMVGDYSMAHYLACTDRCTTWHWVTAGNG
ncbi:hypothetical protein [Bifidobacterium xylocopae]|uniref:Uncharacterized protein n=1 Tax=Bifidobacterium xylocopae TaxID=2493119 RepID=A0A366KDC2_9BIFI|nr:hypothetical protein [Bifidobacterium xylocopae]RBP99736.1 hypothetical protein CRD59_01425 [Bifidobacterium xylocopae]